MSDQWRLFIALELPEQILTELTQTQTRLKVKAPFKSLRWAKPGGIHLTLRFLGDTPVDKVQRLSDVFESAIEPHQAITLISGRLGCFPNFKKPSVLFVHVEGQLDRLNALQKSIERTAVTLDYPPETRPYTPHLTLARIDRRAVRSEQRRTGEMAQEEKIKSLDWEANSVSLIRSELKADGAVYTTLRHFSLSGGG